MINLCTFFGHCFRPVISVFLPARKCARCGLKQIKIPEVGALTPGWTDVVRRIK